MKILYLLLRVEGRDRKEGSRKKALKRSLVGKEVKHNTSTEPQGVLSHMSLSLSQGKFQGEERKKVLQAVQEHAKVAACAAVTLALEAFLEAEVGVKLGWEKGESRLIAWQCGHCGCRDANQLTRDGYDQRDLSTGWGHLSSLRVPMLACQWCQHDVVSHGALIWGELGAILGAVECHAGGTCRTADAQ